MEDKNKDRKITETGEEEHEHGRKKVGLSRTREMGIGRRE